MYGGMMPNGMMANGMMPPTQNMMPQYGCTPMYQPGMMSTPTMQPMVPYQNGMMNYPYQAAATPQVCTSQMNPSATPTPVFQFQITPGKNSATMHGRK
ncbi:unnamed protein product [Mesocestoides corti]|uniref:Uncharacterized protein n=1 Tax=Mesocestoides corti TaxID=53468 RepID=A0A0R3UH29_MESCO|nr:unnamed protein product [Mesocestoides corti]